MGLCRVLVTGERLGGNEVQLGGTREPGDVEHPVTESRQQGGLQCGTALRAGRARLGGCLGNPVHLPASLELLGRVSAWCHRQHHPLACIRSGGPGTDCTWRFGILGPTGSWVCSAGSQTQKFRRPCEHHSRFVILFCFAADL